MRITSFRNLAHPEVRFASVSTWICLPSALAAFLSFGAPSISPGQSQEDRAAAVVLEPAGETNLNRIGLSYRMGFNMSAHFGNLGGFAAHNPVTHLLHTPSGDAFNYDNGYIYPDQTTSSGHPGYTWYYGYQAGTAQRPAGAPTDFDLYTSSSPGNLSSHSDNGQPQHGLELTYNRQFGHPGILFWGLEAGAGFTDVTIQDDRTLQAPVVRNTSTFRTGGGAILNPPPFGGTVTGPGPSDTAGWPLVGLSPVSSSSQTFAGAATVSGTREFDAQVFSFRLGPYLDVPLSHRWLVSASAGLLLLEINSDFKYNETVTINSSVSGVSLLGEQHQGSASANDFLAGGYVEGDVSFAVTERLRLLAGAQFQTTSDYVQTVGGKSATLNLGQSVFVTIGLAFSF